MVVKQLGWCTHASLDCGTVVPVDDVVVIVSFKSRREAGYTKIGRIFQSIKNIHELRCVDFSRHL